jgi:negative regulator of replication initiation
VSRYDGESGVAAPAATEMETQKAGKKDAYTGKKVGAFNLRDERHTVSSRRDVLLGVMGAMRDYDRSRFDHVAPTLTGRKRPYVTLDQGSLRAPQLIPHTNLFVETNLSSQMIVGICYSLIEQKGLDSKDLTFEVY